MERAYILTVVIGFDLLCMFCVDVGHVFYNRGRCVYAILEMSGGSIPWSLPQDHASDRLPIRSTLALEAHSTPVLIS